MDFGRTMPPEKLRRPKSEIELLRAWTEWATDARKEYLAAILRLTPAERLKDRGASFGSIQGVFVHILDTYLWWFHYVARNRQKESKTIDGAKLTAAELRQLNARVDRAVRVLMKGLTPESLARLIVINGVGGNGKPYRASLSLADIIWHMHEEELQHRGELNAMFWQMDIDPNATAWWPG
jgi:uncharacterized damage-inducible protein DinB